MKYAFADKDGIERAVDIPESYIRRQRAALDIGLLEACRLYLADEGYAYNSEDLAPTEEAEGRWRKEDPVKRDIMQELFTAVCRMDMAEDVYDVELEHPERIISFSLGEDRYAVTLSKRRKNQ